jgi:ribonuclease P protein component
VFKKASRSRDKFFTVLFRDNKQETAKLGLAISKKHCRKATARNRIKRVIRESFRQNQALIAGLDIVVLNQPAATLAANDELTQSLAQHWQRCASKNRKNTTQDS